MIVHGGNVNWTDSYALTAIDEKVSKNEFTDRVLLIILQPSHISYR